MNEGKSNSAFCALTVTPTKEIHCMIRSERVVSLLVWCFPSLVTNGHKSFCMKLAVWVS